MKVMMNAGEDEYLREKKLHLKYRVVRQWWIIRKPPETCQKPPQQVSGRFPTGFQIFQLKKSGNLKPAAEVSG